MKGLLLLGSAFVAASVSAIEPPVVTPRAALEATGELAPNKAALKALDMWVGMYRRGKIDLSKDRITKSSPGVVAKLISPASVASTTHGRELEIICRTVAKLDNADAAMALLNVASIGIGKGKYTPEMQPAVVRRAGEVYLDKLKSPEAHAVMEDLAKEKEQKGKKMPLQAAAYLYLGRRADITFRPFLQKGLEMSDSTLRMAAADAAGRSRDRNMISSLANAARSEEDEGALLAQFTAIFALVRQHREAVDSEAMRRAVDSAINALGRTTWRADMVAVDILEVLRSAESVPALIKVLERWDEDKLAKEDLRSGTLRNRAHEALLSLTGAVIPYDALDTWREWWERVRAEFAVVPFEDTKKGKQSKGGEKGRTVTGDFFGIPVRGARVLFIVDTSGSMNFKFFARNAANKGMAGAKIDAAKSELIKAVNNMTVDQSFNLVNFSNGSKAWVDDMVTATAKAKKKFTKSVEKLRADGGTNLWEALVEGLKFRSQTYGGRYGATFDEVFILSDGLPTLGEVQDPGRIIDMVTETNRYSKVTINTIYIAGDPKQEGGAKGMSGSSFMEALAKKNGGKFVGL